MSPAHRLAAFYFAYFCYLGTFGAYFPLWLAARGYSPAQIAAVLAAPQAIRIVAPAAWGWIADLWGELLPAGRRGIVALSSLLAAASLGVLAFADRLAAIFAGVTLMALFSSGVLPLVEATTLATLRGRPERYGPIRLWGSLGFIASVLAAGALLDRQPVAVLLPLVVVLMTFATLAAMGLPATPVPESEPSAQGLAQKLREARVIALFAACFCMSVAHGALYAFYSIYLVEAGYSKTAVGMLWTLGVLAEIGLFLFLPALFRRWSLRTLLIASFGAAAARFLAIGWGVSSPALLASAQLLHALTFGAYHAAAIAAVHRLFTGALAVRGQALYSSLSYGLGGAVGTLLSGWCWSTLGPSLAFSVSAGFGAAGALLVAWRVRV